MVILFIVFVAAVVFKNHTNCINSFFSAYTDGSTILTSGGGGATAHLKRIFDSFVFNLIVCKKS